MFATAFCKKNRASASATVLSLHAVILLFISVTECKLRSIWIISLRIDDAAFYYSNKPTEIGLISTVLTSTYFVAFKPMLLFHNKQ